MSLLFLAVVEATEEAIYNSLFRAEDMVGFKGHKVYALPIGEVPGSMEERGHFIQK